MTSLRGRFQLIALSVISGIFLAARPVWAASSFYYELQGGVTQIRGAAPFFGTGIPATADMGAAFNLSLAYSTSGGQIPFEVQIGLNHRLSTGSNGTESSYSLMASYPMVRIQMSQIFVTVGATPLIWRRVEPSAGIENFSMPSSAWSYLGEAGFLWSVTPQFSLGTAAAAQFVKAGEEMSPQPVAEVTAVLRFYFGFSGGGSGARSNSSNEFKGWRYPFGNELRGR